MSKQKRKKVSRQLHKPFPVVHARLRPVSGKDADTLCGMNPCQGLKLLSKRPQALFMAQICGYPDLLSLSGFTKQEQAELAWEKAYRDQRAGKEPEPIGYPICAQCTATTLMQFLGGEHHEQNAALLIASSVTTGEDLVLFDRNYSRDRRYPSVAIDTFKTLADFWRQYWEQQEEVQK